ncbi:MAG TPA: hypothetical protein VGK02_00690 [Candidatus Aquicultor sp.]|jgi:hypothetical protein
MDISTILILFVIGFFIGLTSRLFYAAMTGKFRTRKPDTTDNVRYISPKTNSAEQKAEHESGKRKKAANE